ncbi:hypothetical protein OKW39_007752 [Paraburkholderia sp. MM6662-R1]
MVPDYVARLQVAQAAFLIFAEVCGCPPLRGSPLSTMTKL